MYIQMLLKITLPPTTRVVCYLCFNEKYNNPQK